MKCKFCNSENVGIYKKSQTRKDANYISYKCRKCRKIFIALKEKAKPKPKKSYSQDWSSYNAYQTQEKIMFMKILNSAVNELQIEYKYCGNGRPNYALDDMIKICCIKVFNGFSQRRTMYEINVAHALGFIHAVPHYNSIGNYFNDAEVTEWLQKLYKLIATPLVSVESNFATDATGFSLPHKEKWASLVRKHVRMRDYKKLHIVCGVLTNVITSATVTEGTRNDTTQFETLVKSTSSYFKIREMYADGGYLSRKNCEIIKSVGGSPYIMPRKNTRLGTLQNKGTTAWRDMLKVWKNNEELFREHYHKRSNVESTFSMMKRKFLPYVRSKNSKSQENEILCKVVVHNISVLVNSVFELGVETKLLD
ncbi:MAG: transposase [Candidatus Aenigmarchaeota archaeon]|nr:transposase [Candidatus Aenigmarchaeota archaeon]